MKNILFILISIVLLSCLSAQEKSKELTTAQKQQRYEHYITRCIRTNNLDSLKVLNPDTTKLSKRYLSMLNGSFKRVLVEKSCDSLTISFLMEQNILKFPTRWDSIYSFILAVEHHNINLVHYWLNNSSFERSEIDLDESGDFGYIISPFGKALEMNSTELKRLFYEKDIFILPNDLKFMKGESIKIGIEELIGRNISVDSIINNSLLEATYYGHTEKVKVFSEYGGDLTAIDQNGVPLFHYTVLSQGWPLNESFPERLEIAKHLIEQGVDVNSIDNQGRTAAHIILGFYSDDAPGYEGYQRDRINFLKLFVKNNIDLNIKDNNEQTFFDLLDKSPHNLVKEYVEKELKR